MLKLVNFARVPSFFGSNCYVIISIIIFIFALKHQLDLNTWVCQYLNKVNDNNSIWSNTILSGYIRNVSR